MSLIPWNVLRLCSLRADAQKYDEVAVLPEINPISKPKIGPQLKNSFHNCLGIAEIPTLYTIYPVEYDSARFLVRNSIQPLPKRFPALLRLVDSNLPWPCLHAFIGAL